MSAELIYTETSYIPLIQPSLNIHAFWLSASLLGLCTVYEAVPSLMSACDLSGAQGNTRFIANQSNNKICLHSSV